MPFFSVLIPSYNRPEYLSLAVASVLASDFTDFELIISDNKSPRQSEIKAVLEPLLCDVRLQLVLQTENLGEPRNRHFLMEQASGEYRIILGDDDLLASNALRILHEAIRSRPGYDLYLFGYALIDETGRLVETRRALHVLELHREDGSLMQDLLCSDLHPFWLYHPATFCFPASLPRDIQPNHRVGIGDDMMFLFDAMLAGKRGLILPEALFSYRKWFGGNGYSQMNLSRAPLANVKSRRLIFEALRERNDLPSAIRSFLHSRRYRKLFLDNAILIDPDVTEQNLVALGLAPDHLADLRRGWPIYRGRWFRRYLQMRRVWQFVRYFGIAGIGESIRIAHQRRAYRRRSGAITL